MRLLFKTLLGVTAACGLLCVWMLLEPGIIIVRHNVIEAGFGIDAKIALISDMHLGRHKTADFMARAVEKVNQEDVQYLFIAGDLSDRPALAEIPALFAPLRDAKIPVYAVLGNHDTEPESLREGLEVALENAGVRLLNNESIELNGLTLLGLGDHSTGEDDVSLLERFAEEDNVVVLTHDPDTTLRYENRNADVTLVGHTHCGQVRLPVLYKYAIPTDGDFDKGYSGASMTKLYITCGLGESGLPIRLFNPPVIDILTIQ